MERRLGLLAVLLALLSFSGGRAMGKGGIKVGAADGVDATVFFDSGSQEWVASGALGTVRSEPLTGTFPANKSIGCWIDAIPGSALLTCEAVTEAGDDLRCTSHDATLIALVAGMNSDAMLTFTTPTVTSTGAGVCSHISVDNVSIFNVKSP
jgi:hypothetical protein